MASGCFLRMPYVGLTFLSASGQTTDIKGDEDVKFSQFVVVFGIISVFETLWFSSLSKCTCRKLHSKPFLSVIQCGISRYIPKAAKRKLNPRGNLYLNSGTTIDRK